MLEFTTGDKAQIGLNSATLSRKITIRTGSGNPNGNVLAVIEGDLYLDAETKVWWYSRWNGTNTAIVWGELVGSVNAAKQVYLIPDNAWSTFGDKYETTIPYAVHGIDNPQVQVILDDTGVEMIVCTEVDLIFNVRLVVNYKFNARIIIS